MRRSRSFLMLMLMIMSALPLADETSSSLLPLRERRPATVHLCPGVLQRHRAVPDFVIRGRVGIECEIAQPFELVAFVRLRFGQRRFALRRDHFQGVRV